MLVIGSLAPGHPLRRSGMSVMWLTNPIYVLTAVSSVTIVVVVLLTWLSYTG